MDAETARAQELRRGDSDAFERLVRERMSGLLALARRLLGDEPGARAAVARAFREGQRCGWRFEGSLDDFLRGAVAAAAFGRLRPSGEGAPAALESLLPRFLEDGHHESHPPDWAAAAASSRTSRAAARDALEHLPGDDRAVLLLRDVAGLGARETARGLGLEEDEVKRRLHRARQALRALLEPQLRSGAL